MVSNIYATCVDIKGKGILLLGDSGSGKSDLALRLITFCDAKLVADDRVDIAILNDEVIASAPTILKDLLEVRGVGIIRLKSLPQSKIELVVKLTKDPLERMPEKADYYFEDKRLPLLKLNPFENSAPAKVLAALSLL